MGNIRSLWNNHNGDTFKFALIILGLSHSAIHESKWVSFTNKLYVSAEKSSHKISAEIQTHLAFIHILLL